ncbi:MAG TPA: hypothetical protein VGD81_00330 [Opitutaceae bacterium]
MAWHQREIERAMQALTAEIGRSAAHPRAVTMAAGAGVARDFSVEPCVDCEALSAYLATQSERLAAVLRLAYPLIRDGKLSRERVLQPLLQAIAGAGEPLLVAAAVLRTAEGGRRNLRSENRDQRSENRRRRAESEIREQTAEG